MHEFDTRNMNRIIAHNANRASQLRGMGTDEAGSWQAVLGDPWFWVGTVTLGLGAFLAYKTGAFGESRGSRSSRGMGRSALRSRYAEEY
jgi:hypothetical protein